MPIIGPKRSLLLFALLVALLPLLVPRNASAGTVILELNQTLFYAHEAWGPPPPWDYITVQSDSRTISDWNLLVPADPYALTLVDFTPVNSSIGPETEFATSAGQATIVLNGPAGSQMSLDFYQPEALSPQAAFNALVTGTYLVDGATVEIGGSIWATAPEPASWLLLTTGLLALVALIHPIRCRN